MQESIPKNGALADLRFEPTAWEVKRSRITRILVLAILAVAELATVWGLSLHLIDRPSDPANPFVMFLMVGITAVFLLIGRLFAVERVTRIADGTMQLPFPIRTPEGRVRVIRLDTIRTVSAEPRPGEPLGARIQLKDGAEFYISWQQLGNGGARALESLCRVFGGSFVDTYKEVCYEGTRWKFHIASPRRLAGSALELSRAIQTFTRSPVLLSNETRRIDPQAVREVEPVEPRYAGLSYLVTLSDETFFLIRKEDADRLRLFEVPAWREKLRERAGPWLPADHV